MYPCAQGGRSSQESGPAYPELHVQTPRADTRMPLRAVDRQRHEGSATFQMRREALCNSRARGPATRRLQTRVLSKEQRGGTPRLALVAASPTLSRHDPWV